jgi:hypothetical protein
VATVAIVAHSQAGHIWRLAEAICDGAMATNPFGDPQDMSPADLATAASFGQRLATFLAAGKTPNTPTSTSPKADSINHLRLSAPA